MPLCTAAGSGIDANVNTSLGSVVSCIRQLEVAGFTGFEIRWPIVIVVLESMTDELGRENNTHSSDIFSGVGDVDRNNKKTKKPQLCAVLQSQFSEEFK